MKRMVASRCLNELSNNEAYGGPDIRFIVTHTSLRYLEATIGFIVTQLIKTFRDRYPLH
jgi:hypothetical protein